MQLHLNKPFSVLAFVIMAAALTMGFSKTPTPDQPASGQTTSDQTAAAPAAETAKSESPDTPDGYTDIVLGDPDAPITVIEYASMTCSHCAAFHKDVFHDFKTNYVDTGRAKFIMRHFILNGPDLAASMIARCVDKKRYYAFIDLFLGRQASWIPPWQAVTPSEDSTITDMAVAAKMDQFLRPVGISTERMKTCLETTKLRDDLLKQRLDGSKAYQITGTPTIIVNGEIYKGDHTYEAFDKALKNFE